MGTSNGPNSTVKAVINPSGNAYLGGEFSTYDSNPCGFVVEVDQFGNYLGNFDGGFNGNYVSCLQYSNVSPNSLFAGGFFSSTVVSGLTVTNFAAYNSSGSWIQTGSSPNPGLDSEVNSIGLDISTGGNDLILGGKFGKDSNNQQLQYCAKFSTSKNVFKPVQASSITPYGVTTGSIVYAVVFDASFGFIYIGGSFSKVGDITASNVARYNLSTGLWEALTGGETPPVASGKDFGEGNQAWVEPGHFAGSPQLA
jgi:hypothetical protein